MQAGEIIAEAERRTGTTDHETHLRGNLEVLVGALNAQARLPARSQAFQQEYLTARTADRLEGLRWIAEYPEIAEEPIEAPVFLGGLPRSGTTFFQYLFHRDPRFRLIRTWEAIMPSPPPGYDPASVVRRKAEEGEKRRALAPPIENFDALHLMDADGPEECGTFLEQGYAAAGFQNLFRVPSYYDWLVREADLAAAYRVHRRQLQLLQWRGAPSRWALKYPGHALFMDEILQVYPDARFVVTHRDPVQVLASISNLTLKLRQARSDEPADPHEVGREMLRFIRSHIDKILAFTNGPRAGRVTHVDYYRLLDGPAAVMAEVHAGLEIDSPEPVRAAVADWHAKNPKNARGANPYALEQFGLRAEAVAEQFGDYMRRFDVPREAEGLGRR
jgi:hypothetical protein